MILALGLIVSGFALLSILIMVVPPYVHGRMPSENEHRAALCALVLSVIVCLVLLGVLL
jgi:hypothetical protein